MLRKDGVVSGSQLREPGANFFVARLSRAQARVPERDAGVPDEAVPLRPLHRASAKRVAKFLLGERDQPFQIR